LEASAQRAESGLLFKPLFPGDEKMDMTAFLVSFDRILIECYRISGCTFLDYLLGTFVLALCSVMLGELTISLALKYNRAHVDTVTDDMIKMNNLSIMALKARDKASYKACNDTANEAFGKHFFTMVAYSASSLWPAFFALAWMQARFGAVEFPLSYPINQIIPSTGYVVTFLVCYVLARILFKNIRRYLPYFKTVQRMLDGTAKEKSDRMMSFADLMS
jgi:hypothetical protein